MVLRSLAAPAWLSEDGAERDVVISSRARLARNLHRYRFPHWANANEKREILRTLLQLTRPLGLEVHRRMSTAELDFLMGCRLVSPEFESAEEGRALLLDSKRRASLMINEEDHLRLQVLTPGWSVREANTLATELESNIPVRWAHTQEHGYLTASVYNCGSAKRLSALFHLIGLAHTKRLHAVLHALTHTGLIVRGLFGETSRPVGAFFQVSSIAGQEEPVVGAAHYLIEQERLARAEVDSENLASIGRGVAEFAVSSRELSLADALRVLAFMRWGAAQNLPGYPATVREVDHQVSTLEIRSATDSAAAARERAHHLRPQLEGLLASR